MLKILVKPHLRYLKECDHYQHFCSKFKAACTALTNYEGSGCPCVCTHSVTPRVTEYGHACARPSEGKYALTYKSAQVCAHMHQQCAMPKHMLAQSTFFLDLCNRVMNWATIMFTYTGREHFVWPPHDNSFSVLLATITPHA